MDQARAVTQSFATIVDMMRDRALHAEDQLRELVAFRDQHISAVAGSPRPVFYLDFPKCGLRVVYDLHHKFKVNDVKKLLDFKGTVILVSREKPGTLALKGLREAASDVQVFDINELQFNVARHVLVPRHEPVRDEAEIERIVKAACVRTRTQLPIILNTDAMARYLALRPGEVARIVRLSPSAGEYVSYRLCVKAV